MTLEPSPYDARQAPAGEERGYAHREQAWAWPHWAGGRHVNQQNPHADELPEATKVIERSSQMRSKFFSISRRVSRSITGRPCGQTVEYDVARSSSRICAIFS